MNHSERAAINTPIQGSAADVAMMAMLKLHHSKTLKDIGWRLLLQVRRPALCLCASTFGGGSVRRVLPQGRCQAGRCRACCLPHAAGVFVAPARPRTCPPNRPPADHL